MSLTVDYAYYSYANGEQYRVYVNGEHIDALVARCKATGQRAQEVLAQAILAALKEA